MAPSNVKRTPPGSLARHDEVSVEEKVRRGTLFTESSNFSVIPGRVNIPALTTNVTSLPMSRDGTLADFHSMAIVPVVALVISAFLRPVDAHLSGAQTRHPAEHLWLTATNRRYLVGFLANILLSTGGFMLMPFATTFSVNNLGITFAQLPMIYMITGCFTVVTGPLIGKLSDSVGKYRLFLAASVVGIGVVLFYTRLGITPVWEVVAINVVLFATISGRMISASALMSGVPEPTDRGAYMSIGNSMGQFAGGVASWIAGKVVVQSASGHLEHYPLLGMIVASAMLVSAAMLYQVHRLVMAKQQKPTGAAAGPVR